MNQFHAGILEKIANDALVKSVNTDSAMRTTDVLVPSDDDSEKTVATTPSVPESYDPAKQLLNSVQRERLHALFQKSRR